MSNTRHARRRLNGHPLASAARLLGEEQIGVIVGWCDVDHVEEAKKQTHDTLIELMGDTRTGGVSWRLIDDPLLALSQLDAMREGADEPHIELYDKVAGFIREHGGVLVIATAPGRPGSESGDIGGEAR